MPNLPHAVPTHPGHPRSHSGTRPGQVRVRLPSGRTAVVDSSTARNVYAALQVVADLVIGVSRGAAGQR
jgi:hypothetical protein